MHAPNRVSAYVGTAQTSLRTRHAVCGCAANVHLRAELRTDSHVELNGRVNTAGLQPGTILGTTPGH